jgi:hypothetical protein
VTERPLAHQLDSPSGTGRDEPRSRISLPARTSNNTDANQHHILTGTYAPRRIVQGSNAEEQGP